MRSADELPSAVADAGANALFLPYSPRIVVEWLRDTPDRKARVVDGSLVFADVSGFTALSERLAKRGKVGAEELVEVLNATTARLLGVASADGGSLIKFGGDAVLLLFTGAEHAARACRAAVGMRGALREAWRLRTSAGDVQLRISQGVYSGPIHFFLVGDLHRELILAGPAATVVADLESAADAGEVLISEATAAELEPRCVGERKEPGWLLRRAPAAGAATLSLAAADASAVDMSVAVPVAIREHLLQGGGDPEHRHVTMCFVRFDGLDAIIGDRGEEHAGEVLDDLISRTQDICEAYDVTFLGTDVYHDGGKVFLAAGAPRATGNDEEHLLRAARAIVGLDSPLGLRAGVNAGDTFVYAVGPPFRRTYTAMGDTTNLAARLVQKAERGTVLATLRTLDRCRATFVTQPLPPFTVKGKSILIEAAEVGPISDETRGGGGGGPTLVGRDEEMLALRRLLDAAARGRGHVVEVVGDAGVGKSRLVQELARDAAGVRVLTLAADEYGAATPYLPWRRLIRQVLELDAVADREAAGRAFASTVGTLAPHLRPWLPLAATVVGVPAEPTPEVSGLDPKFRKPQLEHTLSELLGALLDGPTLLAVEDAQWLDDASEDLLVALAQGVEERPWLVCVTARSGTEVGAAPATTRIALSPLDGDSAHRLAAVAAGDAPLPPHLLGAIVDRAGGNPLFLLELVANAGSGRELPSGVEGAVASRVDQLAPPDRALLRDASVLGTRFPLDLAAAVLESTAGAPDDPTTWRRLAELVDVDDRWIRFRSSLVRDVCYGALPYRRRRDIHGRVAEALEDDRFDGLDQRHALLSLHATVAGRWEPAWRWSREAGDEAALVGASVEAVQFLSRALEAARHLDIPPAELATVGEALGDAASLAGQFDDARRGYRLARQHAEGDVRRVAELIRKEGFVHERDSRYEQARRWYQRGIRLCRADPDDPALAATRHRLELSYAAASAWEGRYQACIRYCRRVLDEAEVTTEPDTVARAYYLMDWALTDLGSSEAAEYRARALPIFEALDDHVGQANVLNNLGVDAYYEGRWAEAVSLWERSLRARERAGDVLHAADATHNIGEVLSDQGRVEEAEEHFRAALRTFRSSGYQAGIALGTSNLGRAAARQGRFDEALVHLEEAAQRFTGIGADRYTLETRARIAEVLALRGDTDAARRLLEELLPEALSATGAAAVVAMLHRLHAYTYAQAGDLGSALVAAELSLETAEAATAPFEIALALEARARLRNALGVLDLPAIEGSSAIFDELGVVACVVVPLEPAPVRGAASTAPAALS